MEAANRKLSEEIQERQQIQAELQQKRQFLQALLDSLSDAVVACDQDRVLTLFNQATHKLHGLPQESISAERWSEYYSLYHPDGVTPLAQSEVPLFRAWQGESVRDMEIKIVPPDQSPRTVLTSGEPILTPSGEKLGAVVAMRDITERKQIEAQLRESEALLRSIYEGSELGMFVIDVGEDREFRYLGFNPTLEKLSGVSSGEAFQKTPEECLLPEAAAIVRSHYQDCLAARQTITYEEYVAPSGEGIWWLTSLNPLFDSQSRIYRIVGTTQNINHQKQVAAQLQESLERYQVVAENSSDLIATQTSDGVYLYVSPVSRKLLGYEPEALMGRSLLEFMHPEDLAALERTRSTISHLPQEYVQSYRIQRQDGTYIWLETTNKLIDASDEDTPVVVSVSRDITERKQAEMTVVTLNQELEQALAERKNRLRTANRIYRAVINSIQEVIFQTDKTGRWIFLSPAWTEITGFPLQDSLNNLFLNYVYAERDQQCLMHLFQDLIDRKRDSWTYEFRCPTQQGGFRWLEMHAQLNVENNEILGSFGAINDVTDQKQAEAILRSRADELARQRQQLELQNLQLQETSQLKSRFLATMSHELRTPMNAILGFTQMLQTQQYGKLTDHQRNMLNRIFNNSQNLLEMLTEILDFSKLEAGRIELKLECFNLNKFVVLTVEELRSLADKKKLSLRVETQGLQDPEIFSDKSYLRRVLVNLVSNAIKFTIQGEVVVKVTGEDADWIAIVVKDTGIGIDHEYLETIFEAFRQVDQTLTRQYLGTGLGLAIAKSLIEMIGGHITVESELGQGSSFRAVFPRKIKPAEEVEY
ncbi:MAG: PAS domain S-box protein [Oscillatoriales cyanobacterium RM2_1_1]|nr:PAS domain S-box protein [Oscillatoriales cyanobacterium RM2_1_1]